MSAFSPEEVSYFIQFARDRRLTYLEVEIDDKGFGIELPSLQKPGAEIQKPPAVQKIDDIIRSPLVGYFRANPELVLGANVTKNSVVGIVEALGLPNEVAAGVNGKIEKVFAQDGAAVEYGQPLAKVGAQK